MTFRRLRLIEMGFIKGKKVDVLLNAPLQDPVKYKIMGYEVSLKWVCALPSSRSSWAR